MKKLASLLLMTPLALTASAYGYESNDSSGWLTFMYVIIIVAGILQVILFFKVWGMTDDIKAIKKKQVSDAETNDASFALSIRENMILGNRIIVRESLLRNFLKKLENDRYSHSVKRESDFPIEENIEVLKKQLDKIGEPLPEILNSCKTYKDFENIFTSKDLEFR